MRLNGYGFSVARSQVKNGWEVEVTNPASVGRTFRLAPTPGRAALLMLATYPVRMLFALLNRPWPMCWQLY